MRPSTASLPAMRWRSLRNGRSISPSSTRGASRSVCGRCACAATAAAKSLTLGLSAAKDLAAVSADRDRLLQVLSNLIGNAVKFTPEGGTVEVRVEPEEGAVHFSVSDTGPGISPENLPRLFQPFWQAQRGSLDGAGLGLMIARGIVEAHGGAIQAESTPGHGSTFSFTIPAASPPPDGERRHELVDRRAGGTSSAADFP